MNTQITACPKLYIGIDIHKRSWKVHCSTDLFSGKSFSMEPYPEGLLQYVSKHFAGHEVSVAYEAGCCGYHAHRCFEGYGWCSMVVNPADIHRKGKERHTKTDRIDAQLIARELKDGRLESIVVPDMEREQLRSLFRRRNDLVKDFRRIKSYIKMQLLYFGIKEPAEFDNDHWSHAYRKWLDDMVFRHPTAKATLDSRLRFFRFVDQDLREVSTQLRRYCKVHYKKDYMLLRSIPGVHQSGGTHKTMGMTMRAHRLIRSYFVEAAWQAIRADPVMQAYYRKHLGRNTKSIIIKVARKLLSRTLAVIKTGIPYAIGVVE